ncbi:hypothetical protein DM860_004521 [Cuscuta australis]|uniref:Uncharacterized protein n=1 Tax=Cuscuta australis TaxID=267555 RepID=A0A328E8Y8_9ASTE|nr:hypothetical protein DM860_004521 [Cuscuta australis]
MAARAFLRQRISPRRRSFSASSVFSYTFTTQSRNSNHRRKVTHSLYRLGLPFSLDSAPQLIAPFSVIFSVRSFSTRDSASVADFPLKDDNFPAAQPSTRSLIDGGVLDSRNFEELFLPIGGLISLLDGYHDLTGLPWWVIIVTGTLAMRLTIFPFIILLIHKIRTIGEILPKLPPPLPQNKLRRSLKDQIKFFMREKRTAGCPSFVWFIAAFIQVPYFLLWLTTIRRMSLDCHDGFNCGGTLWFQNLTELPNGTLGPIFPFLVAGLYFANIKVSYRNASIGNMSELAKFYKLYLEIMTLPTMFIAFYIPQGSLVCWVTNSSLSLLQQIALNHPAVCMRLGLPGPVSSGLNTEQKDNSAIVEIDMSRELREILAQNPSPSEMVGLSTKFLEDGQKDVALPLLRLALNKDPEHIRALAVLGQALLHYGYLTEATEYLERAISKLLQNGHLPEVEDINLLILSSVWAGVAYARQGKFDEGIIHLHRITKMKEPQDSNTKANYYEALVAFSRLGKRRERGRRIRQEPRQQSES